MKVQFSSVLIYLDILEILLMMHGCKEIFIACSVRSDKVINEKSLI